MVVDSHTQDKNTDTTDGGSQLTRVLWINLRYNNNTSHTNVWQDAFCQVKYVHDVNEIDEAIRLYKPGILYFDFDWPNQEGFSAIGKIKSKYPSLPVLVATEDNSVEWAILALRLRVWDYFIKPVESADFKKTIESLAKCPVDGQTKNRNLEPAPIIPANLPPPKTKTCRLSSRMAVATTYILQRIDSKLTLEDVAKHCGMSKSHFSRSFKSVLGKSFQEYLCQQRIEKALDYLKNSDLPVTEIALAVGFPELSNFSTTFERHIGMRPSGFRKAMAIQNSIDSGAETITAQFLNKNPNPALSFELDGRTQFINPATIRLLRKYNLANVENILPHTHKTILESCIDTGNSFTEKRRFACKTIVWSYHPIRFADAIFVCGYDITELAPSDTYFKKLPAVNPNPVLTSDAAGNLQFMDPATKQLMRDFQVKDVEDLLPDAHKKLVKACMKSNSALTAKHRLAEQTFTWSYQPIRDRKLIYIYGHLTES